MKTILKHKKAILAVVALLLVAIAMWAAYQTLAPKGTTGAKELTITVVFADETSEVKVIRTDAEMLDAALVEHKLIEGEESAYGLYIVSALGHTADAAQNEFWSLSKDREMLMTGVSETPIADGDHYEITLSKF